MTSFRAVRVKFTEGVPYVPWVNADTPVAVVPLNRILAAKVFLYTIGAEWLLSAVCR